MLNHLDNYIFSLDEPERSCLLFLRQFILAHSTELSEQCKFNTPFYYYNGKWFCYILYNKKTKQIYISFVLGYKLKHPKLVSEGRKQVKIFRIDPEKDIDVKNLKAILKEACKLYK